MPPNDSGGCKEKLLLFFYVGLDTSKRDCASYRDNGVHGDRRACGNDRAHDAQRAAGHERLDVGNGCQYDAVLADALAVLNYVHDHTQGDAELEVDGCVVFGSYGHRNGGLYIVYGGDKAVLTILFARLISCALPADLLKTVQGVQAFVGLLCLQMKETKICAPCRRRNKRRGKP